MAALKEKAPWVLVGFSELPTESTAPSEHRCIPVRSPNLAPSQMKLLLHGGSSKQGISLGRAGYYSVIAPEEKK